MMDMDTEVLEVGGWPVRLRTPAGDGPHPVLVMVHGLTGDEDIMWIFAGRMPKDALIIAPRGLNPARKGGYSWYPDLQDGMGSLDAFRPAVQALDELLTPSIFLDGDFSKMRLLGFSQGAALTYVFAMLHPERVLSFGGLAGFMPEGAEVLAQQRPLVGKAAFVAHGTEDQQVRVEMGRHSVEVLEQAGARVTYCEDQVGHKLSANCFRGLGAFFAEP